MLARQWTRAFCLNCGDWDKDKRAARKEERRRWQRDWDGWR